MDKPHATLAEGLYGTEAVRAKEYRHRLVDLLCYNRARTVAAIEIVSASLEDRERDLVAKRIDYAQAGIEEYWIVDPAEETVTVLSLTGDVYSEHGFFGRGEVVTSSFLPELTLPVSEILDAD
ncbi:MAG: Uma2 family endonuclease [Caldilineaceae bacterium]|nr:Uma2 family endonuclease [Caldilineaceae bacterium]